MRLDVLQLVEPFQLGLQAVDVLLSRGDVWGVRNQVPYASKVTQRRGLVGLGKGDKVAWRGREGGSDACKRLQAEVVIRAFASSLDIAA